ncbi:hypothetical protein GO491_06495 [Flavobacteriaceae bacterium Ap0902]|nr:hypothetical protein [Flavobacteriaceae bacterium Ap0902]
MKKIYKGKREGLITYLLIASIALPIITYLAESDFYKENPLMIIPLLIPLIIMYTIYFKTSYKIEDGVFYYVCGAVKGDVKINDMMELEKVDVFLGGGIGAALTRRGMYLKFNEDVEFYIAPADNDG